MLNINEGLIMVIKFYNW